MSGNRVSVMAPCKLNLYLDVTERRPDGYHNIHSIMQTISLYNQVTVAQGPPGIRIHCDTPGVPTDSRNTAYKAADLFAKAANIQPGWDIELKKTVPHEAGLGSASADAAGTLVALSTLYHQPLSEDALLELAARVGADVPFLLLGGTMQAEGIGDRLTPLPPLEGAHFVIVKGTHGCATFEVYNRFDQREPPASFCPTGLLRPLRRAAGRVAKHLANRLEYCLTDLPIAEQKHTFGLGRRGLP